MLTASTSAPTSASEADPLAWVSSILWPDGSARLITSGPEATRADQPRWWASPSVEQPRVLIPADSILAARRAVRRYHDGFDLRLWARSAAAELVMRSSPVAERLLSDRVITIDGPADVMSSGVFGHLSEQFGGRALQFAVSLATPKSNRKPVIQILDHAGLPLGWAKVGWNDWTRDLVGNEATWLHEPTNPPLVIPAVIADSEVHGLRIVVQSSLTAGRRPPLSGPGNPDHAAIRMVAERGPISSRPITDTAWWRTVESVLPAADDREREVIDRAVALAGGAAIAVGAWHGDFAPWNVMTVGTIRQVVDWEFAADEVPLGFDLCHYHTQVGNELLNLTSAEAIDRSARLTPRGLAALGVEPGPAPAIWRLYLVELIRRTLALRAASLPTDAVHHGVAAVDRLARLVGLDP